MISSPNAEVVEVAYFDLDQLPQPLFAPDRPAILRAMGPNLDAEVD